MIGSVVLENDASVWFNTVVRGDNDLITIGEGSNVQDNSVLHTDEGVQAHRRQERHHRPHVMLHGCTIGEGSLIGIKSMILNNARIGKHCLIGANALITEGKEIPDRSLVVGSPGKVVRQLTDEEVRACWPTPSIMCKTSSVTGGTSSRNCHEDKSTRRARKFPPLLT